MAAIVVGVYVTHALAAPEPEPDPEPDPEPEPAASAVEPESSLRQAANAATDRTHTTSNEVFIAREPTANVVAATIKNRLSPEALIRIT
jgi:hypothetical protein